MPKISIHLPSALLPPVCPSLSSLILISSHLSLSPASMVAAISQSITLNPFFFPTRLLIHLLSLSALLPQKIKGLRIFSVRHVKHMSNIGQRRPVMSKTTRRELVIIRLGQEARVSIGSSRLYTYSIFVDGKDEICNLIVFCQALVGPEEKH